MTAAAVPIGKIARPYNANEVFTEQEIALLSKGSDSSQPLLHDNIQSVREYCSSFHVLIGNLYTISGLHTERVVLVELNATQVGIIQKATGIFLRILYKHTEGFAKADPLSGREVHGILIPEGLYRALEPLAQEADRLPVIHFEGSKMPDVKKTRDSIRAHFENGLALAVTRYAYKESLKDEPTSASSAASAGAGGEKKAAGPASDKAEVI